MHFQEIGTGFVFCKQGLFFKPIYERHPANWQGFLHCSIENRTQKWMPERKLIILLKSGYKVKLNTKHEAETH